MRKRTATVLMVTLLVAMGFLTMAMGQRPFGPGQAPEGNFEDQLSELRERLALTDEQAEQVRPILEESREKMLALRDKFQGQGRSRSNMQSFRAEIEKLTKETEGKLEMVLTDEQMKEYKEIQEARRDARRGRRGQRPGRR